MRLALAALLLWPRPAAAFFGGDPYARMSKALAGLLKPYKGKKTAVVPFRYTDDRASEGGAAVAASLETGLANRGVRLVERAQLDKLLEEISFQKTGLVPAESALKIGRLSGADFLVTGTLTDLESSQVEVNAKLIRVETGEVLGAVEARVARKWAEAAAPQAPPGPAALPGSRSLSIALSSAPFAGAARRVGDRDLSLRYADEGRRPVVRVTDYTDRARSSFAEVPIRYDPGLNQYKDFSRDFGLAGKGYRLWADLESNLHLAPLHSQFWGGVVQQEEVVIPFDQVFKAWLEDIEGHSQTLAQIEARRLVAYFEPLKGDELRISILAFDKDPQGQETLQYSPLDVEVLSGKRGKTVASRLLKAETKYFRFHYRADTRGVTIEEAR